MTEFKPDMTTYIRAHAVMSAIAMAAGMAILWALGNPHLWTGAVGGLAAVAVRAFYLASDELDARWDLTNRRLLGPQGRVIRLADIAAIRSLGSALQVISRGGDKHLLKYLTDRASAQSRIETEMTRKAHE